MKALLPLAFLVFVSLLPAIGQVGLDNTAPDPSSVLDLSSTEGGLLVPRMTTQQREAITSPANSLLVFDTSENRYFYYDNDRWNPVSPWSSPTSNGDVHYEGNVGIGTSYPQYTLDVNGSINTTALHINGSPFPATNFHSLSNGIVAKSAIGNWNDYKETGFYTGDGMTNASPGSHNWRYVTVIRYNSNYCIQYSSDFRNEAMHVRSYFNSSWSAWKKVTMAYDKIVSVKHNDNTRYGYIEFLRNDNMRGAYIGWGNGDDRVEMFLDNASEFYVNKNLTVNGTFTENSDIRLKDNIEPIDNALGKVLLIEGVTYTRKDLTDNGKRHIGIIADDLAKIVPELVHVSEDDDEMKSVSYSNMVALLVEAIKEQQAQAEGLKNQIEELRQQIEHLKGE